MHITIDLNLTSEDLSVEANQQRLFQGLEAWQQLGLLSHEQVRQLCEQYLSVPLPPIFVQGEVLASTATDFVVAALPSSQPRVKTPASGAPSLLPRLLQSFVAEISVIWLLFLGVFLVVVSSGVLAATQWRNFHPIGQYGILFAYTLAFWGASVLIGRQERLHLTARMLSIATLLIIPVNFWMMDGLGVGKTALGWVMAAIASVSLTAITIRLLNPRVTSLRASLSLVTVNAIALSGLHWGWGWSGVPLIATYVGTIGTAICLLRSPQDLPSSESEPSESEPSEAKSAKPFPLTKIAIAFAVLLLIGRAIFVAQVPPDQLGLAFGVCGWLLIWLSRPALNRVVWGRVGAALLGMGWLVSVSEEPPWQAIAVSGLGLWLLWRELQQHWRRWQLTAFLWVGLQAFWLLWFLLPTPWREGVIAAVGAIAGAITGWELASVGGMVYVGLMVALASRLRRGQQSPLARQTEGMALGLGCLMVALAWAVPLLRSLTLSMAVLTLVGSLRDRPRGRFGVYFTHAIGLAALLSWISTLFPRLNETAGAGVLLTLMVLEWSFSFSSIASSVTRWWRKSAWYAGLVLAVLAYLLLWTTAPLTTWNLIGLATPIMLTVVALRSIAVQPRIAAGLSVPALVLQLFVLDTLPPQIITLGVGTLLLFINSRRWRSLGFAMLTVGFGLGFVSTWIYQEFAAQLTPPVVTTLMAIALWGLWTLRGWLQRRTTPLRTVYAIALEGWAIGLCSLILLILTAYSTSFYSGFGMATEQFVWAAGLTTAAVGYRQWQQSTPLGLWGLAWAVELLVAGVIILVNPVGAATFLAIATLALGFTAQLLGDWRRITQQSYRSWHAIPLTYAVLGFIFSHHAFTEFTGLYTLAAALIWVGVGRRQSFLRPITYLALAGVSIAFYELLIYQLLQAEGGDLGDGITLLAGLAALIAVGDRLLSRWLLPYLRVTPIGLNIVAHLHWAIGSGLALLALIASLSSQGVFLWIGISAILSAYALAAGNRHLAVADTTIPSSSIPHPSSLSLPSSLFSLSVWTYAGIIEAAVLITYALYQLLPDPSILGTWGAAIAAVVCLLLYPLPWERWGWSAQPWKQSTTIFPALVTATTFGAIALQALLIVGAFYAWLAKLSRQLRLSYITILLLDWAVLRFLGEQGWLEPLWMSAVIGGSVLYIVQIDPELQDSDYSDGGAASHREKRHLLRMLATGLICLTALYQAEVELQPVAIVYALLTLGLSIGLILLGLVLQVRAFLYVGTATFMLRVLRLLWLFVNTDSVLLWAVGIVLGLIFIWIAATFEVRRTQVNTLVQHWTSELAIWE